MPSTSSPLVAPYGGTLVDLLVAPDECADVERRAATLPSIRLSDRTACDLELLATGGFSPLDRFMGAEDHASVVETMRLADGTLFPLPVTLPVDGGTAAGPGDAVALRDGRNEILAILDVEEAYGWDRAEVARAVLGTADARHPLVAEMERWGDTNLSGRLRVLRLPQRRDFRELRLTPAETRRALAGRGRSSVVALQTRNPLHRAHEEIARRAIERCDGTLLLHPAVGLTKPGDVDLVARIRAYRALVDRYFDSDRVLLALVPLAMRMAGPREAVWHALVRRNHGADRFVVGRDHASPGAGSDGRPFYGPYAARELAERHADELGVDILGYSELVYLPDEDRYEEITAVPPGTRSIAVSGSLARDEFLRNGRPLPAWLTRPEVAEVLAEAYPPRHRQGVCIWFTGLSGSGKSTTADALTTLLIERGRQVTVLDGDVVRTHLSTGLGYSKADRDANVRRIGFVAGEIVRHGGVAICAAVSPYRAARNDVRCMIGEDRFVEVFVDTPLEVCEARDPKGMYARARRGEIDRFTGIDDPYERPVDPELSIETVGTSPEVNAERILAELVDRGFVRA